MSLKKKLGILLLLYVILGFAYNIGISYGVIPFGEAAGPLNVLFWIFYPIALIWTLIAASLGLQI
ncbi:MAG: hypothetical protein GF411_04385 [Candidatus Lokiarchaeota archaeon]|nr:hypothetical protein [Candidatus Lokiarchaeota archaeon]